jgi:DNA polymerase elongation subunit (family B)
MRILIVDIETRPNLAWCWGLFDQTVGLNQIVEPGRVICWAAKWHGERDVMFGSEFHDGRKKMLRQVWQLIDEADVVVGYNSKNFDLKHLSGEFLLAGLGAPSPWRDVDLLQVVRRRFRFPSNRLQFVAGQLGLGSKTAHDGFELWVKCIERDPKAWAKMRQYNIQDVRLTESLYDVLLPWIVSHPNRRLIDGEVCPRCGEGPLHRRGFVLTAAGRFPKLRCKSCGGYSRSARSEGRADVHPV